MRSLRSLLLPALAISILSVAATGFATPRAITPLQSPQQSSRSSIHYVVHYKPIPQARTIRSSSTSLRALSPSMVLLRGGAAAAAGVALDLSRESLKLQSMAQYSTITALIMNASLRLFTSVKFSKNSEGNTRWVEHAFTGLATMCIICGVCTAVLFNVLGIYSKEALGRRNDAGYLAFQTATAIYRKWGFRTFLATCWSFVGGFLISVYEKIQQAEQEDFKKKGGLPLYMFAGSVLLTLLACVEVQRVLNLATKFIYTAEVCAKNNIA